MRMKTWKGASMFSMLLLIKKFIICFKKFLGFGDLGLGLGLYDPPRGFWGFALDWGMLFTRWIM